MGRSPIPVTARVIAATNRELKREIAQGRFREDLYYRVGVVKLTAPPLRDRGDDIAVLANYFPKSISTQYRKSIRGFGAEALAAMKSYSWPGNVRELENKVKRAVIMSEKKTLTPADLDLAPAEEGSSADSLKEVRDAAEKDHVVNRFAFEADNFTVGRVPEPGALILLNSGLLGLVAAGRKKFRK